MPRFLAPILLVMALAGCGEQDGIPPVLATYTQKTIVAGKNWGDLQLGRTTLQETLDKFGPGKRPGLIISDETGFELTYKEKQVAFLFLVTPSCQKTIGPGDLIRSIPKLQAFLDKHPPCKNLPLTSLAVSAGPNEGKTFFKGTTDKGVRLFDPTPKTFGHGVAEDGYARLMAGLSPNDPPDRIEYKSGISFHYDRGTTGKLEDTKILRITIFRAE